MNLALVRLAITCRVTGCCEWNERAARRVRADPDLQGLTPEGIKQLLYNFASDPNNELHECPEQREGYRHLRDYYYYAIIPIPQFRHGLFVEMALIDDDQELPVVHLVNAHEERR